MLPYYVKLHFNNTLLVAYIIHWTFKSMLRKILLLFIYTNYYLQTRSGV